MGTLILSDLRAEVLSALGNRGTANGGDITDARVTRVLNLMQERMARTRDWKELRFTESLLATFTGVPTTDKFLNFSDFTNNDFKELWTFRVIDSDGSSEKLGAVATAKWDRLVPEPEFWSTGQPSHYTVWKDKFEFWRVPDQAYTYDIRGINWPTVFTTDGQKSDLDRKDDLLIWLTVSWFFNSQGMHEKAGRYFGMFSTVWQEAHYEDHYEPDQIIKPDHQYASRSFSRDYWVDPFQKEQP